MVKNHFPEQRNALHYKVIPYYKAWKSKITKENPTISEDWEGGGGGGE